MKLKHWFFATVAIICVLWSIGTVSVPHDGGTPVSQELAVGQEPVRESEKASGGVSVIPKVPIARDIASGSVAIPRQPSTAAMPPVVGYKLKGVASGVPLRAHKEPSSASRKGVVQSFSANHAELLPLQAGARVDLPLPFGAKTTGTVLTAQRDAEGVVHLAGVLDEAGYFALAVSQQALTGHMILSETRMAYVLEVDRQADGSEEQLIIQRRMESIICESIPLVKPPLPVAAIGGDTNIVFNSMPQAQAVIYIDFEGGIIDDPVWTRSNGGAPIDAKSQGNSPAEMLAIAQRVAEDFAPFNINVTTERSRYDAAPAKQRTRCIVTSTNFRGSGGVAMLNSFGQNAPSGAGRVSWAFNGEVRLCAVTISHEVGHTLGLNHDGRTLPEGTEGYYSGHGTWGPIMGAPFDKNTDQWSRGDYQSANNKEDDLAMITAVRWGFGYRTDEAGDSRGSAAALKMQGGQIAQDGYISTSTDIDYYAFTTAGGSLTVTASPAAVGANLDTELALEDSKGTVLASSSVQDALPSSLAAFVQPGQYYLRVKNAGNRDPLTNGYPSYGSLGAYEITGKITAETAVPVIVSPGTASGHVGSLFTYTIAATNNPTAFAVQGTLPSALSLDSATGVISGKLQQPGSFNVTLFAANGIGPGSKVLTITSTPALRTLAEALNQPALQVATDGNAPWFVDSTKAADGVASASSGKISNGQSSRMRVSIPGPTALSFKWAVSSEDADKLQLWVNGSQRSEIISGERDWELVSLELPNSTNSVEWRYVKDANRSEGQDAAWIDELKIGAPPRIITPPKDLTVNVGETATFQVVAFGATGYQWSKNGRDLPRQTTDKLVLTQATAADEGQYNVAVKNSFGTVTETASLKVVGAPVIAQHPQDTVVSEERSVTLYLRASGGTAANPLTVTWMRDGKEVRAGLSDAAAKWGVPPYAYSVSTYPDPTSQGLYVLSISKAYLCAEGEYYAEVKSGPSTVTSLKAKLQVNPVLTQSPANVILKAGSSGTLAFQTPTTAFKTGTYPAKVLWFKGAAGASPLSDNDNNASLRFSNAKTSDSGTYYFSISSLAGMTRSTVVAANLLVAMEPVISKHPVSSSVSSGANASFSVTVTGGTPPIRYQWWFQDNKGGAAMNVGADSAVLNILKAQTAQAGSYWVDVLYPAGKVTSSEATLVVKAPELPAVMAAGPVFNGVRIPFVWSPEVGGWVSTSEITQAQFTAVSGQPQSVFRGSNRPVENVTQKQAAMFCQRITSLGLAQKWLPKTWQFVLPSDAEWLAVTGGVAAQNEIFGRTPQQGTADAASGGVSSTGLYGGMGNVSEWGRTLLAGKRSVLGGAWDSTSLTGISTPASRLTETSRSGDIGFRVYLLYSPEQDPLSISLQPQSLTVPEGASARFAVTVNGGTPPYRYQWRKDGMDIPGANLAQLTTQRTMLSSVGVYSVVVTAGRSRAVSNDASLTVNGVPPPTGLEDVMARGPVFNGVRIEFSKIAALKGWVGLTEVTQDQFLKIMKLNPSQFVDLEKPVENLSWNEAAAFCEQLNVAARAAKWLPATWAFTLPSESEYLYMLGRSDPSTAVLGRQLSEGTSKIRTLNASVDGLFDVRGNVREWCRNWSDGSKLFKVQSGGSCLVGEDSDARRIQVPGVRQPYTGLRVALFVNQPDTSIPPQLTRVPLPQKGKTGGSMILSGAATGTQPLSYQWLKDGQPIPGANQASFRISPLKGSSAGSYALRVTNVAGVATSPSALVEVESGASIDTLKLRLATPVNIGPASFKFEPAPAINGWVMPSEVSQDQYSRLMGGNPSVTKGGDLPVHNLKWDDAASFCDRLTTIGTDEGWLPAGWEFALPSEREWETLAGIPDFSLGWYDRPILRSVADGQPNAQGLLNMFGNVAEWTRTWYDASLGHKSLRGGSIKDAPSGLVPVERWSRQPGVTGALASAGFRVVVVANPSNVEIQAKLQTLPANPEVTLNWGSALALSAKTLSSPGVVAFQWLKDGTPIQGATTASYAKATCTKADAGDYTLRVNGVTLAGWRVSVQDIQYMQRVTSLQETDQSYPLILGDSLLVRSESERFQTRRLVTALWPYIDNSYVSQIVDFKGSVSVVGGTVAVQPPSVAVDSVELQNTWEPNLGAVSVGDINNDGEQDLVGISAQGIEVVFCEPGNVVRREIFLVDPSVLNGSFIHGVGLELSDLDGDGFLDLVIADVAPSNTVRGKISWLRNLSGNGFDLPQTLLDVDHTPNFSICDFNNDGRPDLLLIKTAYNNWSADSPADVYLNVGLRNAPVSFSKVAASGISKAHNASQRTTFADVDGDGNLDVLTGSTDSSAQSEPRIYFGNGNGTFVTGGTGFANSSAAFHNRFAFADFELSGAPVGYWAGSYADSSQSLGARLWRWAGRNLAEVTSSVLDKVSSRAFNAHSLDAIHIDMDGDGAEDLLVQSLDNASGDYTTEVFRNSSSQNGRRSLLVNLKGTSSPRDGIGARIEVTSGGIKQLRYVSATNASAFVFGLGSAAAADSVKVYWPSGKTSDLKKVPAGDILVTE